MPPAHQGWDDGHANDFGEFHKQIGGIGVDDAATGDDQRTPGGVQHLGRAFDLLAARLRLVDRERLVNLIVVLDLGRLDVDGQVDQDGTRTPRAHEVESLLEHHRHKAGFANRHSPFCDRLCDRLDIDGLEVLLIKARTRGLARDA